jgi:hypothetical protein
VRTRLHTTAADWARHARDPSYLYTGSPLAAATETATRITADPARHPPLSQTERDFLHASERTTVRSSRRRRMLAGALVVLLIAAVAGAGIAAAAAATPASSARSPSPASSQEKAKYSMLETPSRRACWRQRPGGSPLRPRPATACSMRSLNQTMVSCSPTLAVSFP